MHLAKIALLSVALPALGWAQSEPEPSDGPLLLPVTAPAQAPALGDATPDVQAVRPVVFSPVPFPSQVALPWDAGMPEPSVLVGLIEGVTNPDPDPLPDSPVPIIAWDDLEARRIIRAESPDLFASLVQSGAFDPPSSLLKEALQTELSRMKCYTARIDGQWGNGSIAAVHGYYQEIDERPPTLSAEVVLFRQFVRKDDVVCPDAVVTTKPSTGRTSSGGSTSGKSVSVKKPRITPQPPTVQTQPIKKQKPAAAFAYPTSGVFR